MASALLLAFAAEQTAWAAPESILKTDGLRFAVSSLPASVVSVEDARRSGAKTVYLIQDAHTNPSAQLNVAKTLAALVQKEKIKYVFLEAGSGDVSLSFLRRLTAPVRRKQAADAMVRQGRLQGSEYFDLTSESGVTLWGVEDQALYAQSVASYRRAAEARRGATAHLERLEAAANALKPEIYNPFLSAFDAKRQKYENGEMPVTDYFNALASEAERLGIRLGATPHLKILRALKKLESRIDFTKASEEQRAAVFSLSEGELKRWLLESRPEKLVEDDAARKAHFAMLEEALGPRRAAYPELSKYLRYLRQAGKIRAAKILKEQSLLENALARALAMDADERELYRASSALRTLKKLAGLTLSPQDYDAYRASREDFDVVRIAGFLNRKIMDSGAHAERAVFMEEKFPDAIAACEAFYDLTYQRDSRFVENLISKMDAEGERRAVLITGGYHAPNLKRLLEAHGVSYVSLVPRVLHETDQKRYESILLSQKTEAALPGANSSEAANMPWQLFMNAAASRLASGPTHDAVRELATRLGDDAAAARGVLQAFEAEAGRRDNFGPRTAASRLTTVDEKRALLMERIPADGAARGFTDAEPRYKAQQGTRLEKMRVEALKTLRGMDDLRLYVVDGLPRIREENFQALSSSQTNPNSTIYLKPGSPVFYKVARSASLDLLPSFPYNARNKMLLSEARALARLVRAGRERAVPELLEIGVDEDLQFYLRANGLEIAGPLSWPVWFSLTPLEKLDVMTQIAETLQKTHNEDLLHNDLMPLNVLLHLAPPRDASRRTLAMLIDYGVALDLRGREGVMNTAQNDYARVPQIFRTRASDVFRLGAILHDYLDFPEKTMTDTGLRDLVDRMLLIEPKARPPLSEVVERLHAAHFHVAALPQDPLEPLVVERELEVESSDVTGVRATIRRAGQYNWTALVIENNSGSEKEGSVLIPWFDGRQYFAYWITGDHRNNNEPRDFGMWDADARIIYNFQWGQNFRREGNFMKLYYRLAAGQRHIFDPANVIPLGARFGESGGRFSERERLVQNLRAQVAVTINAYSPPLPDNDDYYAVEKGVLIKKYFGARLPHPYLIRQLTHRAPLRADVADAWKHVEPEIGPYAEALGASARKWEKAPAEAQEIQGLLEGAARSRERLRTVRNSLVRQILTDSFSQSPVEAELGKFMAGTASADGREAHLLGRYADRWLGNLDYLRTYAGDAAEPTPPDVSQEDFLLGPLYAEARRLLDEVKALAPYDEESTRAAAQGLLRVAALLLLTSAHSADVGRVSVEAVMAAAASVGKMAFDLEKLLNQTKEKSKKQQEPMAPIPVIEVPEVLAPAAKKDVPRPTPEPPAPVNRTTELRNRRDALERQIEANYVKGKSADRNKHRRAVATHTTRALVQLAVVQTEVFDRYVRIVEEERLMNRAVRTGLVKAMRHVREKIRAEQADALEEYRAIVRELGSRLSRKLDTLESHLEGTRLSSEAFIAALEEIDRREGFEIFDAERKRAFAAQLESMDLEPGTKALVVGPGSNDYLPAVLHLAGLRVSVLEKNPVTLESMRDQWERLGIGTAFEEATSVDKLSGNYDHIFILAVLNDIVEHRVFRKALALEHARSVQDADKIAEATFRVMVYDATKLMRPLLARQSPGGRVFMNDIPLDVDLVKVFERAMADLSAESGVAYRKLEGVDLTNFTLNPGYAGEPRVGTVFDRAAEAGSRLPDALAAFGVKWNGTGKPDFSAVPEGAEWVMDEMNPVEEKPVAVTADAMPTLELLYPLEESPLLGKGTNSEGVYLALVREPTGAEHPASVKVFPPSMPTAGIIAELVAAQIYGDVGVLPRFYGAVRTVDGSIRGYGTQVIIGGEVRAQSVFGDDPDYEAINDRAIERYLQAPVSYMRTRKLQEVGDPPEACLVGIDAGGLAGKRGIRAYLDRVNKTGARLVPWEIRDARWFLDKYLNQRENDVLLANTYMADTLKAANNYTRMKNEGNSPFMKIEDSLRKGYFVPANNLSLIAEARNLLSPFNVTITKRLKGGVNVHITQPGGFVFASEFDDRHKFVTEMRKRFKIDLQLGLSPGEVCYLDAHGKFSIPVNFGNPALLQALIADALNEHLGSRLSASVGSLQLRGQLNDEGGIVQYVVLDGEGHAVVSGDALERIGANTAGDGKIAVLRLYTRDGFTFRVHYDEREPGPGRLRMTVEKDGVVNAGVDRLTSVVTIHDGASTQAIASDVAGRELRFSSKGIERIVHFLAGVPSKTVQFESINGTNSPTIVVDEMGVMLKSFDYVHRGILGPVKGVRVHAGIHNGVMNRLADDIFGNFAASPSSRAVVVFPGEEAGGKGTVARLVAGALERKMAEEAHRRQVIVLSVDSWLIDRYGGKRPTAFYLDKFELLGESGFYRAMADLIEGRTIFVPLFDSTRRVRITGAEDVLRAVQGYTPVRHAGRELVRLATADRKLAIRTAEELTDRFGRRFEPGNLYVEAGTGVLVQRVRFRQGVALVEGVLALHDPTIRYSRVVYVEIDPDNRLLNAVYRYRKDGRHADLSEDQVVAKLLERSRDEGAPYTRWYVAHADDIVMNRGSYDPDYRRFLLDVAQTTKNPEILAAVARHLLYVPDADAVNALLRIARDGSKGIRIRAIAIQTLNTRLRPQPADRLLEHWTGLHMARKYETYVPPGEGRGPVVGIGFFTDTGNEELRVQYALDGHTIERVTVDVPDTAVAGGRRTQDLFDFRSGAARAKGVVFEPIDAERAKVTVVVDDAMFEMASPGVSRRMAWEIRPLSQAFDDAGAVRDAIYIHAPNVIGHPFGSRLSVDLRADEAGGAKLTGIVPESGSRLPLTAEEIREALSMVWVDALTAEFFVRDILRMGLRKGDRVLALGEMASKLPLVLHRLGLSVDVYDFEVAQGMEPLADLAALSFETRIRQIGEYVYRSDDGRLTYYASDFVTARVVEPYDAVTAFAFFDDPYFAPGVDAQLAVAERIARSLRPGGRIFVNTITASAEEETAIREVLLQALRQAGYAPTLEPEYVRGDYGFMTKRDRRGFAIQAAEKEQGSRLSESEILAALSKGPAIFYRATPRAWLAQDILKMGLRKGDRILMLGETLSTLPLVLHDLGLTVDVYDLGGRKSIETMAEFAHRRSGVKITERKGGAYRSEDGKLSYYFEDFLTADVGQGYDAVTAFGVFDDARFLRVDEVTIRAFARKFREVLKPGGRVFVNTIVTFAGKWTLVRELLARNIASPDIAAEIEPGFPTGDYSSMTASGRPGFAIRLVPRGARVSLHLQVNAMLGALERLAARGAIARDTDMVVRTTVVSYVERALRFDQNFPETHVPSLRTYLTSMGNEADRQIISEGVVALALLVNRNRAAARTYSERLFEILNWRVSALKWGAEPVLNVSIFDASPVWARTTRELEVGLNSVVRYGLHPRAGVTRTGEQLTVRDRRGRAHTFDFPRLLREPDERDRLRDVLSHSFEASYLPPFHGSLVETQLHFLGGDTGNVAGVIQQFLRALEATNGALAARGEPIGGAQPDYGRSAWPSLRHVEDVLTGVFGEPLNEHSREVVNAMKRAMSTVRDADTRLDAQENIFAVMHRLRSAVVAQAQGSRLSPTGLLAEEKKRSTPFSTVARRLLKDEFIIGIRPQPGQSIAIRLHGEEPSILTFRGKEGSRHVRVFVGGRYLKTVDLARPVKSGRAFVDLSEYVRLWKETEDAYALTSTLPGESKTEAFLHLGSYAELPEELRRSMLVGQLVGFATRRQNYAAVHLIGSEVQVREAMDIVARTRNLSLRQAGASPLFRSFAVDDWKNVRYPEGRGQVHLGTHGYFTARRAEGAFEGLEDARFVTMRDFRDGDGKYGMVAVAPTLAVAEIVGSLEKLSKDDPLFADALRLFREITSFGSDRMTEDDFLGFLQGRPDFTERFAVPPIKALELKLILKIYALSARMAAQAA